MAIQMGGLLFAALIGYVGYREAASFRLKNGRAPWGMDPVIWGLLIFFTGLVIGAILLVIARRTTRPVSAPPAVWPVPAGAPAAGHPAFGAPVFGAPPDNPSAFGAVPGPISPAPSPWAPHPVAPPPQPAPRPAVAPAAGPGPIPDGTATRARTILPG